jgi:hypothetical protein
LDFDHGVVRRPEELVWRRNESKLDDFTDFDGAVALALSQPANDEMRHSIDPKLHPGAPAPVLAAVHAPCQVGVTARDMVGSEGSDLIDAEVAPTRAG